ncbi:MAG: alpha-ketoglutarate-dependent dioxygenase AlkB [Pseudomonadota bacterium]
MQQKLEFADAIYLPSYFDPKQQSDLLQSIRDIVSKSPLFVPRMPRTGKPMSVKMTNCGSLGWVTDKDNGYRYQATHPETGNAWPEMPEPLLQLWQEVTDYDKPPEACLINFYEPNARMGLHQDRDEQDFDAPVLSVSLGDTCLFRIGGKKRNDPTQSFKLQSGDVMMLAGESRLAFHGVDRI